MTQAQMAERLGCSVRKVCDLEKRPDRVSLSTLRVYYNAVGTDARTWIKEFADSFFEQDVELNSTS